MSKPMATREQVLEFVKLYFGEITESNCKRFMENIKKKRAKYIYFSYSASRDGYVRREEEILIAADEELRLTHIPGHIVYSADVIITDDGRVLKNRHGKDITPSS